MPQINLYETLSEFDTEKIASVICDNLLIEFNYPSGYPYTGAWDGLTQRAWSGLTQRIPERNLYKKDAYVNQEQSVTSVTDLPESQDPITQTTLLKREEDQVQELIFRIKRSTSICYRKNLADKLLTLFKDAKEEEPDCPGIVASSLRTFNIFLHINTNLKCPTISLTPTHNIYASWRDDQDRVCSIHFLPNMDVRFVIFKPNHRHPERTIRISGAATIDVLMETLKPYGIGDWILE